MFQTVPVHERSVCGLLLASRTTFSVRATVWAFFQQSGLAKWPLILSLNGWSCNLHLFMLQSLPWKKNSVKKSLNVQYIKSMMFMVMIIFMFMYVNVWLQPVGFFSFNYHTSSIRQLFSVTQQPGMLAKAITWFLQGMSSQRTTSCWVTQFEKNRWLCTQDLIDTHDV